MGACRMREDFALLMEKQAVCQCLLWGEITVTVYADMEKELHETTLFPRKALRPMSLAGLDNLFVYVLIIAFPIGKSRKFTVPGGFSAVFQQQQGIPALSGRSVCRAGLCRWL